MAHADGLRVLVGLETFGKMQSVGITWIRPSAKTEEVGYLLSC
jgi:hypothetical protein